VRTLEVVGRFVDTALVPFHDAGLISAGHGDRRAVALTFDDGPSPANTPSLLDLLARHGARATFFVVGQEVWGNEAILRRAVAHGHELANHTFSHPHSHALTRAELRAELVRTNNAITEAAPADVGFVRPPFGKDRRRTAAVAAELGLRVALWSLDSGDARGRAIDDVVTHVTRAVRPGAIVLFHDGGDVRPTTLGACERIVPALCDAGLELVTLSELIDSTG
jgi:peptidoglycan/xylan/chitin deacetylase (PgdA/CDA1 family)